MPENKILEFDQPADFYYRAAQRMMDNADFISALPLMRTAVKKEPDHYEYGIALAEVLTELARFEESNRVLFEMIERRVDIDADCFFCLGCNFMGMNDFEKARESFEKYLQIAPEGEYRDEVEDFFLFFDAEMEEMQTFLADANEDEACRRADEGKRLLDAGEYEKAVEMLENIGTDDITFSYAKNNLALAYYCMKNIEKAQAITQEVLQKEKNNVHANCNMAVFLYEMGKQKEAALYLERLMGMRAGNAEDVFKIAVTLCELKQHEKALRFLRELRDRNPYDEKVLFYLAIASYNTKKWKDALNFLGDVRKLDYPGVIAEYYIKAVNQTIQNPEQFCELDYIYQVPAEEARSKIRYLNNCLKLPAPEFRLLWKDSLEFYNTALWGLEYGDENIKLAIAGMIAGFADKKAESVLRSFILKKNQPDSVKNEVFVLLKRMNAKEPYAAYIGGEVVEVKVGAYDEDGAELTNEYKQLFTLLNRVMEKEYPKEALLKAFDAVQQEVESGRGHKLLESVPDFAAAVVCVSLERLGEPFEIGDVCSKFGATETAVTELFGRLKQQGEKKRHDDDV